MADLKDPQLYMRYVGALTVLGTLAKHARGIDERYPVAACFDDANALLAKRQCGLKFERMSGGGWAPVEVNIGEQPRTTAKAATQK